MTEAIDAERALMTTAEVAAYFRVTARTIRNWVRQGLLTPVRQGRTVRFRRSDIMREHGHNI